jgi:hypothetical protein
MMTLVETELLYLELEKGLVTRLLWFTLRHSRYFRIHGVDSRTTG